MFSITQVARLQNAGKYISSDHFDIIRVSTNECKTPSQLSLISQKSIWDSQAAADVKYSIYSHEP